MHRLLGQGGAEGSSGQANSRQQSTRHQHNQQQQQPTDEEPAVGVSCQATPLWSIFQQAQSQVCSQCVHQLQHSLCVSLTRTDMHSQTQKCKLRSSLHTHPHATHTGPCSAASPCAGHLPHPCPCTPSRNPRLLWKHYYHSTTPFTTQRTCGHAESSRSTSDA